MRIIDADALKKDILKQLCIKSEEYLLSGSEKMIYSRIDKAPTVERNHGEWIIEYHGNGWNDYWDYTCFVCGKKFKKADNVLYRAKFCPNCGAYMKGAGNAVDAV